MLLWGVSDNPAVRSTRGYRLERQRSNSSLCLNGIATARQVSVPNISSPWRPLRGQVTRKVKNYQKFTQIHLRKGLLLVIMIIIMILIN